MSETIQSPYSVDQLQSIVSDPSVLVEQLPTLVSQLAGDDDEANACIIDALVELQTLEVAAANRLRGLCNSPSPLVAGWVCKLLVRCNDQPNRFESDIVGVLQSHPSVVARQDAALALSKLSTLSDSALQALEAASSSDDPRLSRLAAAAMAK